MIPSDAPIRVSENRGKRGDQQRNRETVDQPFEEIAAQGVSSHPAVDISAIDDLDLFQLVIRIGDQKLGPHA